MAIIPGAMDAGLVNPIFWLGMMIALTVAFIAAFPVNRYLIDKGKGHALTHQFMHGTLGWTLAQRTPPNSHPANDHTATEHGPDMHAHARVTSRIQRSPGSPSPQQETRLVTADPADPLPTRRSGGVS